MPGTSARTSAAREPVPRHRALPTDDVGQVVDLTIQPPASQVETPSLDEQLELPDALAVEPDVLVGLCEPFAKQSLEALALALWQFGDLGQQTDDLLTALERVPTPPAGILQAGARVG
jgi:hypothetical protein